MATTLPLLGLEFKLLALVILLVALTRLLRRMKTMVGQSTQLNPSSMG
jgi:hypothetical protein